MRHLRTDWQGIQDGNQYLATVTPTVCSSILPDEPVFMVRAKDPVAPLVVLFYAACAGAEGSDPAFCARIRDWAGEMEKYRDDHWGDGIHPPDAPELLAC